jgi:hypothetical protein
MPKYEAQKEQQWLTPFHRPSAFQHSFPLGPYPFARTLPSGAYFCNTPHCPQFPQDIDHLHKRIIIQHLPSLTPSIHELLF